MRSWDLEASHGSFLCNSSSFAFLEDSVYPGGQEDHCPLRGGEAPRKPLNPTPISLCLYSVVPQMPQGPECFGFLISSSTFPFFAHAAAFPGDALPLCRQKSASIKPPERGTVFSLNSTERAASG